MNVGDVVKAGQVLATFSADTVLADVAQSRASLLEAQANAAEAAANADRARLLQATGALSQQQIQQFTTAEQNRQGPRGGCCPGRAERGSCASNTPRWWRLTVA
ncbi:MAG: hypothetical protein U1E74_09540 [Paenacidovorax caeni]